MTPEQIETLFYQTIHAKQPYGKAIYKIVAGVSKDILYNWQQGDRGSKPSLGEMMNVLYQMGLIDVVRTFKPDQEDQ